MATVKWEAIFKVLKRIFNFDCKAFPSDCLSEHPGEVVGFTARHSGDVTYNTDDVIQFPVIVTKYGNYYSSETSIFICPHDGMYLFFSTLLSTNTDLMAYITLDMTDLVSMRSYSISNSASSLAFTECLRGTKVWVRQGYDGDIVGGFLGTSFSGYLLQRYEN